MNQVVAKRFDNMLSDLSLRKPHELVEVAGMTGNFKRVDTSIAGMDVDALLAMQQNIVEQDLATVSILPSEIEGIANDPNLSNQQLSAKVSVLEMENKYLKLERLALNERIEKIEAMIFPKDSVVDNE